MAGPVRALIVDDSATMRGIIGDALRKSGKIEVVGEAADPFAARAAIKRLNPDVLTLDVEMPGMNGLDFLERLMRLRPIPVVMVSSLTERGAASTIRAMELGAVDFVTKPSMENQDAFAELASKVEMAAGISVDRRNDRFSKQPGAAPRQYVANSDVVAIGASTGGVEALIAILSDFPTQCPPTVVAIHLPATFTSSFARRLDRVCKPRVVEAANGLPVEPGNIYIAPGTTSHLALTGSKHPVCRLQTAPQVNGHRPSVDVMFKSVAEQMGARAVGVILTGMGRDGADGLYEMRMAGARTIGQDEQSCAVFGMPKVAAALGAVQYQLPLPKIADKILSLTSRVSI